MTSLPSLSAIQDDVLAFVSKEFTDGTGTPPAADDDLLNSGLLDSLGLLKLIAWIESTYDLTVDDADLDPEHFRSAAQVQAFVLARREAP